MRKSFDFGRMRQGVKGQDIDTRAWVETGRVDDDPDAIRWEPKYGLIVDVTFVGGQLDGVGPVACRVNNSFASEDEGSSDPIKRSDHVLVAVISGDPNVNPTILGCIYNDEEPAPSSVNGQTIDEAFALANHILKTTHGIEYEADGRVRLQSHSTFTLISTLIELTQNAPSQAFVRGTAFASAMNTLLNAIKTQINAQATFAGGVAGAIASVAPPTFSVDTLTPFTIACASAISDISSFQSKLVPGDLLSNKIKGE